MDTLTAAFGVWAAVVGLIGAAITWELARLRADVREMSEKFQAYVVSTENRITRLEAAAAQRFRE